MVGCKIERKNCLMTKTVTVLSGLIRPLVETRLPDWVEPRFFQSKDEAMALAPEAEIGWFDMYDKRDMAAAHRRGERAAHRRGGQTFSRILPNASAKPQRAAIMVSCSSG